MALGGIHGLGAVMALGCIHGLGAVVALKGVSMDSCGLRGYPWPGGSRGLKGGINGQLWP